jgi:hypothetical protein
MILWSILCAMRPQPDQYPEQGITVEDSMSMVHLVWHEAPVLTASPPGSVLSRYGDAAGRNMQRLQPLSRLDGRSDRGLRVFQSTSETAARLRPKQPASELVFLTDTGPREPFLAPWQTPTPKAGRLLLGTVRSHDQWNTTIYSDAVQTNSWRA